MQKALNDVRVLDLSSGIAGSYCTKLLAGFGAEVVKIEPTGSGDAMRQMGPFCRDVQGPETSIPFLWLNTGKKSVTLNYASEHGKRIYKALISHADVCIENHSPGTMDRWGLGYESIREINPAIVMASVSNFGQSGPLSACEAEEIALQAYSGIMHMTGDGDKSPLAAGPSLCQYTAGQHAYIAILMALFQRAANGEGQHIDLSMQESALEHIEITLSYNLQAGINGRRGGHRFVPWDTYECEDGYAAVIGMPSRHWHRASQLFDDARLFDDRFALLQGRVQHRSEYEAILRPCVKKHRKRELFHAGQSLGLAFGYVADLDEAASSPQHAARKFFVDVDHPVAGVQRYCDAPFRMSATPWLTERAPLLGEHNVMVYGGLLGYQEDRIRELHVQEVI